MHTEFSETFWLGVETLATVVLMVLIITVGNSSRQLSDIMEQQNVASEVLQDTREWLAYDDTNHLYEADVLSVYYKYKGKTMPKSIKILPKGANKNTTGTELKTVNESDALNSVSADMTYHCEIDRDNTGLVSAVYFWEEK